MPPRSMRRDAPKRPLDPRDSGDPRAGARPGPDGRVDKETAVRLVREAVQNAGSDERRVAAAVAREVERASRRARLHNRVLAAGLVLAFAALVFAAAAVHRTLAAAGLVAEEAGLEGPVVPMPSGALPTVVRSAREIHDENQGAVYLIASLLEGRRVAGCCTAFAVESDLLATNAHCVEACAALGGSPVVVQNGSGGKTRFPIRKTSIHPGYKRTDAAHSPDVAYLRVQGRMPKTVKLASQAELYAIGPGDDAFVLGFPGRVMDPVSPLATFLRGRVGRVTSLTETRTTADKAALIQHDAVTRGGNSGSPLFNQHGHVIGIHAAHLDEEAGKGTTSTPFRVAMRVDLLRGVPRP